MSLPTNERKFLSVPIITGARRRSLPNRLGPWPIKRSRSEADGTTIQSSYQRDDLDEKGDLRAVLRRVDEECAAIDKILVGDDHRTAASEAGYANQSLWKSRSRETNRTTCYILAVLMGLAFTLVFISMPIMTFTFVNQASGAVYLEANAPSRLVFGVIVSLPIVAVGFSFSMATAALMSIRYGWNLTGRPRNAALAVAAGLGVGGSLDVWTLFWLMPLVIHI